MSPARSRRRPYALAALAVALPLQAAEPTVAELLARLQALETRVGAAATAPDDVSPTALDQRLRILERRLELQAEDSANKALAASTVSVGSKGVSLKSPAADGLELRVKALVQADARSFLGDDANPQNDGLLLRRVQPAIEGDWGPLLGFRLMAEFAGDSATLADAYLDVKFDPRATVRAGRFKTPVGLERLQSSAANELQELGFASELAPNRDVGVQLQGDFADAGLTYAVGAFNGAPDGRDGTSANPDDELEYAARVFWEPFRASAGAASGLGIGLAASVGDAFGTGTSLLPRYRTPGQSTFFSYNANVAADGLRRRLSPQGYYYRGPFGLLGEAIESEQAVRVTGGANAGRRDTLRHTAWNLTGVYVLTGEDAGFKGVVRPRRPFGADGGLGAFELVGRYGELDVDDDSFPYYAALANAANRARAWTLGLNWYLNPNLKLLVNLTRTQFEGGAAGGDREDETALTGRAQLSF